MSFDPNKTYTEADPLKVVETLWVHVENYVHVTLPLDFTGVIKDSDGDYGWYKNGKLHREDGPAFVPLNTDSSGYYLYGIHYINIEEWKDALKKHGLNLTPQYFKNFL